MAPSCRNARWPAALALATAAGAAGAAGAAVEPGASPGPATALLQPGQQPITVDAASSEVDYRTNTVVFSQVVISQGSNRIQADRAHATGLNFANSRWTFEGHVRIDAEPRGNLRADEAVVEFRDNRIARATVTGKPAQFEQIRSGSDQVTHGHADQIVYDVSEGTVRLADDAWLSDGKNEITGPLLVYDIRGQTMQAASAPGGQRVHIVIAPPGEKNEPARQPNLQP
jgi:lipopolysaccharide transport protein LptA